MLSSSADARMVIRIEQSILRTLEGLDFKYCDTLKVPNLIWLGLVGQYGQQSVVGYAPPLCIEHFRGFVGVGSN